MVIEKKCFKVKSKVVFLAEEKAGRGKGKKTECHLGQTFYTII